MRLPKLAAGSVMPARRGLRATVTITTAVVLALSLAAATPFDTANRGQPTAPADTSWQQKVAPDLTEALATDDTVDVLVRVNEHADLSGADGIADWAARGTYVVDQLRTTATRSQRPLVELLTGQGASFDTFWITNMVLVRDATDVLVRTIAAEPAVAQVHHAHDVELPQLQPSQSALLATDVEWGIEAIGAHHVWDEFDTAGEQIVVGTIDTGVQFDHPDLVDRYRGNQHDGTFHHDYHWFDPSKVCGDHAPCDNQGHGTHVTGTMVGGDAGGSAIGVAPGAQWIAAKGCEAVPGAACSVGALLSSGQWMLAPTDRDGNNPRPDLRPHIVNNSWGADTGAHTDPYYDDILRAWNAAGMFTVFSNGNSGERGCYTTGSPADSPYAFGVGAHDVDHEIAAFSARGPGGQGHIRPHLAAPGVAVRSSVPDGYAAANGTSMAAPHVAGTAALMWAAAPALIGDVEGTREILQQTAIATEDLSCGGTVDNNNVWGAGRLDAHAAVQAAPTGPAGLLTGQVRDAATGDVVAQATVHALGEGYQRRTTANSDGEYAMVVRAGDYQMSASGFGYEQLVQQATVAEDSTTVLDFALAAVPTAVLSGTVTDGSGHGWPLYASISITDYPHGAVYTDPQTGQFAVELPVGDTYELAVVSRYDGYVSQRERVTLTEDRGLEITLPVQTDDCLAPGYAPVHHGLYESFDEAQLPAGWQRETTAGDGWRFDDPAGRGNVTGGEDGFASIDSAHGARIEDGWLASPPADLSEVTQPVLSFRTNMIIGLAGATATVEVSLDGGDRWEQVWQRNSSLRGPELVELPLPQAAGASEVRARFHYHNQRSNNGYWHVDDMLLGARQCEPVSGGLLVGNVSDDRTGAPVNGATVHLVAQPSVAAVTADTPDDPALPGGYYWLFSPQTGSQQLSVSHQAGQYAPGSLTAKIVEGDTARADVALASGELVVSTGQLQGHAELGTSVSTTMTVENVGTAPASFQLSGHAEPASRAAVQQLLDDPGAPVQRRAVYADGVAADGVVAAAAPEGAPAGGAGQWARVRDANDSRADFTGVLHNGRLYAIGGTTGVAASNMYYDLAEDRWGFTASMPRRSMPAAGAIGDLIYIVGGMGRPGQGTVQTTLVYDPQQDTFTEAAPAPEAVFAAGHAVLADRLYLIGGRTDDEEQPATATVAYYDPQADAWTRVADYPEPAFYQACGAIAGRIYCAGGIGDDGRLDRAYVYLPDSDTWHRIADLPATVTGTGYTAANGVLLLSGGLIGGHRSNEGFYYDPATGAWDSLPNSLFAAERMASACGFYKIGGFHSRERGNVPWVEQLIGLDDCDTSSTDTVPWLSMSPAQGTLAPGETVEVEVTLDASAVDQPGEHIGYLQIWEDTPVDNAPVPVAFDVAAPHTWGQIAGTVAGLARCALPGDVLADASVTLRGDGVEVDLTTDSAGEYSYWVDTDVSGRVEVSVAAAGWHGQSRVVTARPGQRTNSTFTLHRDEPCAVAGPDEITLELTGRQRHTVHVTLDNRDGATAYDYTVDATEYELDPVKAADAIPAAASQWTAAAELPRTFRNYASAQCPTHPDQIFLLSGDPRQQVDTSWRFDVANDSWHQLAPIPESVGFGMAVCEAGRIHVLGGLLESELPSDQHVVYDVLADTWRKAAPLPTPLSQAAVGAWNGTIAVTGGQGPQGFYDTQSHTYLYDVATDSWREGERLPVPVKMPGYAQVGHHLYVAGGLDRTGSELYRSEVQRLDLLTGEWQQGPRLAEARAGIGLSATDTALYAVGGMGGQWGTPTAMVQRLEFDDWADGAWDATAATPLPHNQQHIGGFCTETRTGGEIWSIGGQGALGQQALFLPLPGERCHDLTSDLAWLDLPQSGTVTAGASARLRLTVDAGQLARGQTHTATVLISTTDPGLPVVRIPLRVTVR